MGCSSSNSANQAIKKAEDLNADKKLNKEGLQAEANKAVSEQQKPMTMEVQKKISGIKLPPIGESKAEIPQKIKEVIPEEAQEKIEEKKEEVVAEVKEKAEEKVAEKTEDLAANLGAGETHNHTAHLTPKNGGELLKPTLPETPITSVTTKDIEIHDLIKISEDLSHGRKFPNDEDEQIRDSLRSIVYKSDTDYLIETYKYYTIFVDGKPVYTNSEYVSNGTQIFHRGGYYYFIESEKIVRTADNCTEKEHDRQVVYDFPELFAIFMLHGVWEVNKSGTLIAAKDGSTEQNLVLVPIDAANGEAVGEAFKSQNHGYPTRLGFVSDDVIALTSDNMEFMVIKIDVAGKTSTVLHKPAFEHSEGTMFFDFKVCPQGKIVALNSCNGMESRQLYFFEVSEGKCEQVAVFDTEPLKMIKFVPTQFLGYSGNKLYLTTIGGLIMANITGKEHNVISTFELDLEAKEVKHLAELEQTTDRFRFGALARIGDGFVTTGHEYESALYIQYHF